MSEKVGALVIFECLVDEGGLIVSVCVCSALYIYIFICLDIYGGGPIKTPFLWVHRQRGAAMMPTEGGEGRVGGEVATFYPLYMCVYTIN